MPEPLLVVTWNVNGVRAREAQLLAWLGEARPAVLCLQETKATPAQLSPALCALPGYACYWHAAPKGYSGVALHLRQDVFDGPPAFDHPDHDVESRLVTATARWPGAARPITFASLYMPNGGKDYGAKITFMRAMIAWVREVRARGDELVLCGDMNVARGPIDVHPKLRDPRVIGQSDEERGLFGEMLAAGLVDVQRERAPADDTLFTWWPYWRQHRERNIGWRLDYTLISPALSARVTGCEILRAVGTSDHAPVAVTIGA